MATGKQDSLAVTDPKKKIALISGGTMKEYDQQISDLKKENFSLKLRIYYMEERLDQTFGDGKDVLKMNVQLQTEIDDLKQELIDKQVLVQKAAFAIETLTCDREKDEAIRSQLHSDYEKKLNQLQDELDKAKQTCDISHREVEKVRKFADILKQQLHDTKIELMASNKTNENLQKVLEEMKEEQEKNNTLLDRYKKSVEALMQLLQQKDEECQDLRMRMDEVNKQIHVLQTETGAIEIEKSEIHGPFLGHFHDQKMMNLLQEEIKSLTLLHQQLKDNTENDPNIGAWLLTGISSIQRVYQKLEEGLDNTHNLNQRCMCSLQAREGQRDSLSKKLERAHKAPEFQALTISQHTEQHGLRSVQHMSAETGTGSTTPGVMTSPCNVSVSSPGGHSVMDEVHADDVDSLWHDDFILSNINLWLQTPTRLERKDEGKLIELSENAGFRQVEQHQPHMFSEKPGDISSRSPVKDVMGSSPEMHAFDADFDETLTEGNPEMVSANLEMVSQDLEMVSANQEMASGNLEMVSCNPEMVLGVSSFRDLGMCNHEMNIPSLDSARHLRNKLTQASTAKYDDDSVANFVASSHSSNNKHFEKDSESLDNFHRCEHVHFSDDDQFDFHRHDRVSSVKFDSQNISQTNIAVPGPVTPTCISHFDCGDGNSVRSVCGNGSLLQVVKAPNVLSSQAGSAKEVFDGQQHADMDGIIESKLEAYQSLSDSRQKVGIATSKFNSQQQVGVDQNISGSLWEVDQNIPKSQQENDQNIPGSQLEVDPNIPGNQQQAGNTVNSQQQTDSQQNIFGSSLQADQNIFASFDGGNVEANTKIRDLETKLQATENTVKLLSRKNQAYLSALAAAGIRVNLMNKSSSESCLDVFPASVRRRASSVGSLTLLPGLNNESIERPRSYFCDVLNQTMDVNCDSLATSVMATPSVTGRSLGEDTTSVSGMHVDLWDNTLQLCTSSFSPAVSQNISLHINDPVDSKKSNINISSVSCVSSSSLCFPASVSGNMAASMKASPHKGPLTRCQSSEGYQNPLSISNCRSQVSKQNDISTDPPAKLGWNEVKSVVDRSRVSEKVPPEVISSSLLDGRLTNGSMVSQDRSPEVTYTSVMDNTLIDLENSMDLSSGGRVKPPETAYPSHVSDHVLNDMFRSNLNKVGVSHNDPIDMTYSSVTDSSLMNQKASLNVSRASPDTSPDVTYSSLVDGSLMNRLLKNLELSWSVLKEDTWNISDLSVEQLRYHVEYLERINLALKEEIRVHETLQTKHISPSDKSSSQKEISQAPSEDLLKQYLSEIKNIRLRLERLTLVKDPDHLLIFQSHTHQRIVHQESVITHMQQLMLEKETQWQKEISEIQHKLSREKVLAIEKLELTISQLQSTMREQAETIRKQEQQIVDLRLSLDPKDRHVKHIREDKMMLMGDNCVLESQPAELNSSCFDVGNHTVRLELVRCELEDKKLHSEFEGRQKERLKMEVGKEKDSWRHLKEIVVKREKSLQEKILVLKKLTCDKAVVESKLAGKEDEVKNLELEVVGLKEKLQEMKTALQERRTLMNQVEILKEALRERENEEVRNDFQNMRYDAKIEKITEEKVKLSMDLEFESREKERLKLQLHVMECKVLDRLKLERQNSELKGEMKSLLGEVDKLNGRLSQRALQDTEVQNRLRLLEGAQSQVNLLRQQLATSENSLRIAEQLRNSTVDELKEREERLNKRNQQLYHLLQQYKKLEAAFLKQKSRLKEKVSLVQKMKTHIHDHNLSCSSAEKSLNETKLSLQELNTESYPDAAFSSTPLSACHVRQHSSSLSPKHCRRQLTYSAAETQSQDLDPHNTELETRCPVAVLSRDCHDKLHKKTAECLLILAGVESTFDQILGMYKTNCLSENVECDSLQGAFVSCQRLDNCLKEVAGWIAAAWITELPDLKTQGLDDHPVKDHQNGNLWHDTQQLPSHGTEQPQFPPLQQNKPHEIPKVWEATLYKQLYKTTQDLQQAKANIDATLTNLPSL